ncbi:DUF1146 domain-containing protein [Suicoccus acidiformans]|uniref:DUF1146 domain-containing protein n=2 Tax=Suicoccus acidiformans TaxID=2036206 RepID=A0A347WNU7_9LACT|nr:DUF1146 domain-containing protein [Suicoccus acidiformans]
MSIINGMAVLVVRMTFVVLSYVIFKSMDWRKWFSNRNYHMAAYACLLISVAIGHLVGSFAIEMIELLQRILMSLFLP